MRFHQFLQQELAEKIPLELLLPTGFHLVGHVALLHIDEKLDKYAEVIGDVALSFDKRIETVAIRSGPTLGVSRQPDYRVVAGKTDTITTHIENGIRFRLDPMRLTFSGGNKTERLRMGELARPSELILDMFACVGQFSLHMAKTGGARVKAIEVNEEAHNYLLENIVLNGLEERVEAYLGDCRVIHPEKEANRVVMGFLHDTLDFLPHALESLVSSGGVIHLHQGVTKVTLPKILDRIHDMCSDFGYTSSVDVHRVKEYAPRVQHVVFDIVLKR